MEKHFKRIIIVAPRSISNHTRSFNSFRLDYAYWNFYIPLLELGYEVKFFDTSLYRNKDLKNLIQKFNPDLLFCIMTGSPYYCPEEPWQVIEEETKKGNITTFNWFCDDSWRFNEFSSSSCFKFHYCSTPELKFIQKYKEIGYNNIVYSTWHANHTLYSIDKPKTIPISFIGNINKSREFYISYLKSNKINILTEKNIAFEDMINSYASSLIGLNFSKNSDDSGTQMKARMFEIPACKAAMITEYTEDIENNFEIGKEILCFRDENELLESIKKLTDEKYLRYIMKNGHDRFLKDHTSHIRLSKLLEKLK